MIPQTVEYALRAVVHLAWLGGGPAVTEAIAAETKVPAGYLARILRTLARGGLLTAQRGVGGGFALARSARDVTVWDVLVACDSSLARIRRCPLGNSDEGASLCALHSLLDEAIAGVEARFRRVTLHDLLHDPERPHALCRPSTRVSVEGRPPP